MSDQLRPSNPSLADTHSLHPGRDVRATRRARVCSTRSSQGSSATFSPSGESPRHDLIVNLTDLTPLTPTQVIFAHRTAPPLRSRIGCPPSREESVLGELGSGPEVDRRDAELAVLEQWQTKPHHLFFPTPRAFNCSRTMRRAIATSDAPSPELRGLTSKAVRQSSDPGR